MKAIIKTGGKQYSVKKGDVIDVELLAHNEGDKVIFENILMLDDGKSLLLGAPSVKGATVEAKIIGDVKGEKLIIYKYTRRHNHRVKKGHRQTRSRVEVTEIKGAA